MYNYSVPRILRRKFKIVDRRAKFLNLAQISGTPQTCSRMCSHCFCSIMVCLPISIILPLVMVLVNVVLVFYYYIMGTNCFVDVSYLWMLSLVLSLILICQIITIHGASVTFIIALTSSFTNNSEQLVTC